MVELQPIVCKLSERPNSFRKNGWSMVDGQWVANDYRGNTGMLKRQPQAFLGNRKTRYKA